MKNELGNELANFTLGTFTPEVASALHLMICKGKPMVTACIEAWEQNDGEEGAYKTYQDLMKTVNFIGEVFGSPGAYQGTPSLSIHTTKFFEVELRNNPNSTLSDAQGSWAQAPEDVQAEWACINLDVDNDTSGEEHPKIYLVKREINMLLQRYGENNRLRQIIWHYRVRYETRCYYPV